MFLVSFLSDTIYKVRKVAQWYSVQGYPNKLGLMFRYLQLQNL